MPKDHHTRYATLHHEAVCSEGHSSSPQSSLRVAVYLSFIPRSYPSTSQPGAPHSPTVRRCPCYNAHMKDLVTIPKHVKSLRPVLLRPPRRKEESPDTIPNALKHPPTHAAVPKRLGQPMVKAPVNTRRKSRQYSADKGRSAMGAVHGPLDPWVHDQHARNE